MNINNGHHCHGSSVDSGTGYSASHANRFAGTFAAMKGKFSSPTSMNAHSPGYKDRQAAKVFARLEQLSPEARAGVERDYKKEFAKIRKAESNEIQERADS